MDEKPNEAYFNFFEVIVENKLKLVIADGEGKEKEFSLDRDRLGIGRSNLNQIVLPDIDIGQFHARINKEEGRPVLVDLGTHSGTKVNGEEIQKKTLLPGDKIVIGGTEIEVVGDISGETSKKKDGTPKRQRPPLPKGTLLFIIFLTAVLGFVLTYVFCLMRELVNW